MNSDNGTRHQTSSHEEEHDLLQSLSIIQTDPITGPIKWSMCSLVIPSGHGVHYHDTARDPNEDVVAFIRGFSWLRKRSNKLVLGYYLQPDEVTTPDMIASLKLRIEELVLSGEPHYYTGFKIIARIYARGNC